MKAYRIHVQGIVQAVGFRPFVYRIAHAHNLRGYVRNLGDAGVEIVVEGKEKDIEAFLNDLYRKKPPLAKIEKVVRKEIPVQGFDRFYIEKSSTEKKGEGDSIIPPDIAICEDCLRELFDPNDKRFMYPFIVCTNCGPRFTIIEDLPYDRENTAMREFPMCDFCRSEYEDPLNRRYHAEPVACPTCGPSYRLYTSTGEEIIGDPLRRAAKLIDKGYIVAIKGIGGIHLACDATREDVVAELRKRLFRPQKPFAIMAKDLETVKTFAYVTEEEEEELTSYRRPIVALRKKEPFPLPENLAPGLHTIGVMLPYAGTHYILFHWSKTPVYVMTSANFPGMPMIKDNDEAFEKLKDVADYLLLHNRKIPNRADDSVVRFVDGRRAVIRRSRGFVPLPIEIPFEYKGLAVGAELMNAFGVVKGNRVYPSQYIGNTSKIEVLEFMRKAIAHFRKILRVSGFDLIIADLHPSYNTTKLAMEIAEETNAELLQVQHHYAHIASVMAEHGLEEVVGIALDGVGYGTDGKTWGGEVIYLSYEDVERLAHIEYYPLPGGDLASYYPLRALIGILSEMYELDEVRKIIERFCPKAIESLKYGRVEFNVIFNQLARGINVAYASSTGRVLDAFAVLLNVAYRRHYEGEPAMKLESFAFKGKNDLRLKVPVEGEEIEITELFREVLELMDKANPADIAYSVHLALARAFAELAVEKAKEFGVKGVAMSGGVAYNELIVKTVRKFVEAHGLRFYSTYEVPRGDNGINVGQAFLGGLYLEGYLNSEDLMM
ncbi:carbamoyltransferase HypF [Thermococcus chitonophagus]|uniref:Carbamoyltransferase n=1 Tax=Thermococcus chitonophagus TaxID=54262 RepID=A0A160VTB8_9EURY|nr:carbamoyltransferase HypF [Thermococcus chitonophagus]ASJ17129.1 carbamoyltransferase HypF [Thermococcus chitonophagus]CUX77736.1 [NiFe] hydrogenase metallocenter assembly protein HypF [Thermococcus chitonophagus]